MNKCRCGYAGEAGKFGAHAKVCKVYKEEKEKLDNIDNVYIVGMYKTNYSITSCCTILADEFLLGPAVIRKIVKRILVSANVYEGISGPNTQRNKQQKIQQTMMKRHGVINAGQMDGNGFKQQNKIPYTSPAFFKGYKEFRKAVDAQTRKVVAHLSEIQEHCEYTGIRFADNVLDKVNPNDPCKRTVDHIVSVYECYFNGWSIEETASKNNLVFCLRLCNTIKGNDNIDHFKLNIAKHLREEFINEGYEHTKIAR